MTLPGAEECGRSAAPQHPGQALPAHPKPLIALLKRSTSGPRKGLHLEEARSAVSKDEGASRDRRTAFAAIGVARTCVLRDARYAGSSGRGGGLEARSTVSNHECALRGLRLLGAATSICVARTWGPLEIV